MPPAAGSRRLGSHCHPCIGNGLLQLAALQRGNSVVAAPEEFAADEYARHGAPASDLQQRVLDLVAVGALVQLRRAALNSLVCHDFFFSQN